MRQYSQRWRALMAFVQAIGVVAVLALQPPALAEDYGPTGPQETLWSAAKALMPTHRSASTAQIAWALYRANPEAFEGSPGRLRPGSRLKVPDLAFMKSVSPADSYAFVSGQRAAPAATARARPAPQPPPARPTPPIPAVAAAAAPVAVTAAPPAAPAPGASFRNSSDAAGLPAGAEARYRVLQPLEGRYAGDVDYDYAYGLAAYDSGHHSEAVFILQRAVSSRPGFSGARMELARAYYATGDNESARREFETLKAENPPPEAKRAIDDYLTAVERRASSYDAQLLGFLEASSGFDTNANGGPDVQAFLGITLDTRSQATESPYYGVGLGGSGSYPFAPGWRVLGDARLQHRAYPDASFVDSDVLRLGTGVEWHPGPLTLSLLPSYASVRLDGEENHQNPALDLSVAWRPTDLWRYSVDSRFGQKRFVEELSAQDVNTQMFGLAAQRIWVSVPRVMAGAAVTTGRDKAEAAASQFGRDLLGMRLNTALDFNRGRVLSLSVAQLNSDYDGEFAGDVVNGIIVGESRSDRQLAVSLGLEWGVYRAQGWLFRGQVTHVKNDSGIELYNYDRTEAGLSVVKEFQ